MEKSRSLPHESKNKFITYPKRWAIMTTAVLMNMSNAATWICFFPVAPITAQFFRTSTTTIDWFSIVFMIVPMMCFIVTTYASNKRGLKFLIHTGSAFNCVGALIKTLGTSRLIASKYHQFIISLLGQTIAAVAQSFCLYIPTKLSNDWFPKDERRIATTILSFAYSIGLSMAQFTTPLYVKTEQDIPTVVHICLGLAVLVQIFTFIFVTSSCPPTPPSDAALNRISSRTSYVDDLKKVFSSTPFIMVLMMISSGIGVIIGLNTLTSQMICNVGYSSTFAGACIAIMYCSGYVGSVILTPLVTRNGYFEEKFKILMALSSIFYIFISELLVLPKYPVLLGLSFAGFGFVTTGIFPVGLELSVEVTFPVDESLTTGLAYLFGQIIGIFIIFSVPSLSRESPQTKQYNCGYNSTGTSVDYSVSVTVLMLLYSLVFMTVIYFFKPIFKRKEFEEKKKLEYFHNLPQINR